MRGTLDEYAMPGATRNVCLFVEVNQLINIGHNTPLVDYSGHFCEGAVGIVTHFKSFIHCRHKRRPTVDLSVHEQLVSPIVVAIPGLRLEVWSNNPDKVGVAIQGASLMVKIIVNGFVSSLVRGVGVDGTIICLRLGNLELLLLLSPLDVAKILYNQKAFPFAHLYLPAMSQ